MKKTCRFLAWVLLFAMMTAGLTSCKKTEDAANYSDKDIGDYVNMDALKAAVFFDGDSTDATGKAAVENVGTITYTDGYYGQAAKLEGTGYITTDLSFGTDSFAISLWTKPGENEVGADPCLYSNQDWRDSQHRGFTVPVRDNDYRVVFSDGLRIRVREDVQRMMKLGWVHTLLVVDRENHSYKFYQNFRLSADVSLESLAGVSFDSEHSFNIGQDGRGMYTEWVNTAVDDLLVFDHAITDEEIAKLAEYYGVDCEDDFERASRDGVKARFFAASDFHFGRNATVEAKVKQALDTMYEIDPEVDAVLVAGDITHNGKTEEYEKLMRVIDASALKDKIVFAIGNHDFYVKDAKMQFETQTGQNIAEVVEIAGITVIKLDPDNEPGYYHGNYEMVKKALEESHAKDPTAPILVFAHHGVRDTVYLTSEWYGTYSNGAQEDLESLFKQYPQVIHISGHSHATLEDPRSIYQDDGYTAIQIATLGSYFENEKGKVDPVTGDATTKPFEKEYASQAIRIDVMEDNTVKIYRMDFTDGEYMYEEEPWVFSSTNQPYTFARAEKSAPRSLRKMQKLQ